MSALLTGQDDQNRPIPADEITYKVRCAAPVLVPL